VYVLTVAETERVAGFLREQGLDVAAYSGQTTNRVELEDRLRDNTIKALVATSALGMGYDKPDLAFCVHLGSPASPVAYYQQVGRAGRALEDAQAILVPAESDERIWDFFATSGIPDEQQVERILKALDDAVQTLPGLESATGIRRGRLETLLKILAVDDVVSRESGGWAATGRPWYFDEQKWRALRAVRAAEAGLMRAYAHGDGCLMEFLQQALDDPDPQPCGRCSVCTGTLPAPGSRAPSGMVDAARRYFRGQDVVVEPRKLWPSGLPDRKGKITFLIPGRALAFADDPAWNDELAALGQHDAPAPPVIMEGTRERLAPLVAELGAAGCGGRHAVTALSGVGAVRGGAHCGGGSAPAGSALTVSGPPPAVDAASAVRAKDLLYRTALVPGVSFTGPVLLVDDTIRTRWTATVAAALLADAGATSVLPLAIHQLP
jgi:ATP-dependent DNA helicase RecQ